MNFQNTTNKSSNEGYPKLIEEVNNHWNKEIEIMNKIKLDIKELERMFNEYDNNDSFIDCKNHLIELLNEKQTTLNRLEEHIYILKRNFGIN